MGDGKNGGHGSGVVSGEGNGNTECGSGCFANGVTSWEVAAVVMQMAWPVEEVKTTRNVVEAKH